MERLINYAFNIVDSVAQGLDEYSAEAGDSARAATRAKEIREGIVSGRDPAATYKIALSLFSDFATIIGSEVAGLLRSNVVTHGA